MKVVGAAAAVEAEEKVDVIVVGEVAAFVESPSQSHYGSLMEQKLDLMH